MDTRNFSPGLLDTSEPVAGLGDLFQTLITLIQQSRGQMWISFATSNSWINNSRKWTKT